MIQGKAKKMILEAIRRYAKQHNTEPKNIQVKLYPQAEALPGFDIYQNFQEKLCTQSVEEFLNIKTVMGIKMDPFSLCEVVPAYVLGMFIINDERLNIGGDNINILIIHNGLEKKEEELTLWIRNANEYIEEISIDDLFSDECLMKIAQISTEMQEEMKRQQKQQKELEQGQLLTQ